MIKTTASRTELYAPGEVQNDNFGCHSVNQTGFSGDVGVRHSAAILAVSSAL